MTVKIKVKATHEGQPAEAEIETQMNTQEFVTYVKEILPLIKSAVKPKKK